MVALTKDVNRTEKEGKLLSMPVAAGAILYKNALCKINAAGFIAPCVAEAGASFAGMGYESVDNSGGADGDVSVRLERESVILVEGAGFAAADLGKAVYAQDDNTVSITDAGNEQKVGVIVEVLSATQVYVKMNTNVAK